ncbi:hypothetical protein ACFSW8_16895 [Rubritalea tangerina]|uniref:Carbohydrate-binding module family 96 domain-containing protein n=2 Tax=Rubritalea tangerina TaxID=430798 RepID=A0ABW4ZFY4_9BACT
MKKTYIPVMAALCVFPIQAATISASVSQDTYIRNDVNPNTNFNGDSDNELLVGANGSPDNLRILVGFDLSTITNLVNSDGGGNYNNLTINSASLTVYERRGRTASLNLIVSQWNASFSDTLATWNAPSPDDTTPGASLSTVLGSSFLIWDNTSDNDQATISLNTAALKSAIQNAASEGTLNLVLNSDSSPSNWYSITSDQAADPNRHVQLNLDYSVSAIPEPSSASLASFAGIALCLRRRR